MNDEPALGDGLYPTKPLKSIADVDAWRVEHNPFVEGTTESTIWVTGLYNSQYRLVEGPAARPRQKVSSNILISMAAAIGTSAYILTIIKLLN